MDNKWNKRFLRDVAHNVRNWSKDRSTKVGCVIMAPDRTPRTFGYNGFPKGVNDDVEERHERPLKYKFSEHAERNAIYHCAKHGIPLNGCIIYVTHFPCPECARAIVSVGLSAVVIDEESFHTSFNERWCEDYEISKVIMDEAGVDVIVVDLTEEDE